MIITRLNFHQAEGEYGLVLHPAMPLKPWSALGVFNGVFERYFVTKHEHFQGINGFNIGSEMAAVGHHFYHVYTLAPEKLAELGKGNHVAYYNEMIWFTHHEIVKAIQHGRTKYGTSLHSKVPWQPTIKAIDPFINHHWTRLKYHHILTKEPDSIRAAQAYQASVTLNAIKRLYRWGYYRASKMVHNNDANRATLNHFLEVFEEITAYNPEEASRHYAGIEFRVKPGIKVEWDARIISHGNASVSYKHFIAKKNRAVLA
jgi:hypothetical protein